MNARNSLVARQPRLDIDVDRERADLLGLAIILLAVLIIVAS